MQTGNTDYINKNDLDKAYFQHDMAYVKYEDLTKRAQSDQVLRDKNFKIASNSKYDGHQRGLASMIYKFLDTQSSGSAIKSKVKSEFKRRTVYSSFKDNILDVNLAAMQLINKYNKRSRYLLRTIDLFSKYAWVVPLKGKKDTTIVHAFRKILENSKRKPN